MHNQDLRSVNAVIQLWVSKVVLLIASTTRQTDVGAVWRSRARIDTRGKTVNVDHSNIMSGTIDTAFHRELLAVASGVDGSILIGALDVRCDRRSTDRAGCD